MATLLGLAMTLSAAPAQAQLRIVSYNTAEGAPASLSTILEAIGEVERNGIAKPIDILSLQEQTSPSTTTQAILDQLDAVYGEGVYDRGTRIGGSFGSGQPAVIYNTQSVELIAERAATNTSSSGGPRQTLRYQFRPVGYDESADFYVYSSHFKASTGATNEARREVEAEALRANADNLGEGASLIFTGDLNLYSSSEDAYQDLLAAGGPGQAFDPLNPDNDFQPWNNNSSFAEMHTQSPCTSGCGVGGGVDSRFDFQLVSGELLDAEGLALINGSYHTFGNNGTTYNQSINSASNTVQFPGLTSTTRSNLLNSLATATDHLPLVADYQVPAVLDVVSDPFPTTFELNEQFSLDVSIFNDADVVAALGADELEYTLTTTGDLFGDFSGFDFALGGGETHSVIFDTFSLGAKSGVITVSTDSQSAANSVVTIPVSFEVVSAGLPGDANGDGTVDLLDLDILGANFGLTGTATVAEGDFNGDSDVDLLDLDILGTNFGATAGASNSVPEPAAGVLALAIVALSRLSGRPARG